MAEGGGLLNRYTLSRRIEGSNPSGSASLRSLRASARKPPGPIDEIHLWTRPRVARVFAIRSRGIGRKRFGFLGILGAAAEFACTAMRVSGPNGAAIAPPGCIAAELGFRAT